MARRSQDGRFASGPAPCPILSKFVTRWEEWGGPPAIIQRLKVPGECKVVSLTRGLVLLDWRLRTAAPAWLEQVPELVAHAKKLKALKPFAADAAATAAAATATAAAATATDATATAADAAADAAATAATTTFLREWRRRGYYWWGSSWRVCRCVAYRAVVAGARTREEIDAVLAPTVEKLQESAQVAYWRAVAGPEVVRAAIRAGHAEAFSESLGHILYERVLSDLDKVRLDHAISSGSRAEITTRVDPKWAEAW